jgi:hypothetical protein
VGLTAVVRLVVEQVRQDVGKRLLVRHAAGRMVDDRPGIGLFVEAIDHAREALVLCRSGRGKLQPVVVEDRVQPVRVIAFAGEALQPDPVGDEQVVERAVETRKEYAERTPVSFLVERQRGRVEPRIGPAVIGGKLTEVVTQRH